MALPASFCDIVTGVSDADLKTKVNQKLVARFNQGYTLMRESCEVFYVDGAGEPFQMVLCTRHKTGDLVVFNYTMDSNQYQLNVLFNNTGFRQPLSIGGFYHFYGTRKATAAELAAAKAIEKKGKVS